jgi:hypothetical protein
MYSVYDVLDRTFENWGNMLGANRNDFWSANSEVEMKPGNDEAASPSQPMETPAWESTDSTTECCGGTCSENADESSTVWEQNA